MYYALLIKDGIIVEVPQSTSRITAAMFANGAYAGMDVIKVTEKEAAGIYKGTNIGEYAEGWRLRPLSERVADGYIEVQEGYILDGEEIRPMNQEERIAAGLDEPEPEPPSEEELQARVEIAELLTWFAWYDIEVLKWQRGERLGESRSEIDIVTLDTEAEQNRLKLRELKRVTTVQ